MKRFCIPVALYLGLAGSAGAETWSHAFGQGIREATISAGAGNRITVNCESGFGQPVTGILFTLANRDAPPNSLVSLAFDDDQPFDVSVDQESELSSNCEACAATFDKVRDKLAAGRKVHVRFADGAEATFSLDGARTAIGDSCIADFRKAYDAQ